MAAASETVACNLALATLGEPPLTDYATDTGTVANECRRWFDIVRRKELMGYDWQFATTRTQLTKDVTDPAFGWTSRYQIPTDCLRFLPITTTGEAAAEPVTHEVESGYILVNQTSDLYVRYIKDMETVTDWPDDFVNLFTAALAVALAENLVGLSQALQTAQARYEQEWQRSHRYQDRQNGTPTPYYGDGGWFDSRSST